MGYYYRPMGDYATGGYGGQQGDPGLFSFIGKAVKSVWKIAKPVLGAAIGGPVGAAIIGTGTGVAIGKSLVPVPGALPAPPSMPGVGMIQPVVAGMVQGAMAGRAMGGVCPSGYHPDKRTGTRCVRNRRMNVANPRALRRSMRRVKGFEKLARRTISFTKRVRIKS